MKSNYLSFLRILSCLVLFFFAISSVSANDWNDIVRKSKGQTVYWNAWGGGATWNAYIAWVGKESKKNMALHSNM